MSSLPTLTIIFQLATATATSRNNGSKSGTLGPGQTQVRQGKKAVIVMT